MRQEMRITEMSIKGKSIFIRTGCWVISLVLVLFLILVGCANPNPAQQVEPNLSYIDTLINDVNGEPFRREIGMMRDSLKEGLWISFYPDGKIYGIEFFDKGEWNGPVQFFYENGQLHVRRETKLGVFHGKGSSYYDNGTLMGTSNFVDDKPDGVFEDFYENGEPAYAIEYKNGEYVRTVYGNPPIIEEE